MPLTIFPTINTISAGTSSMEGPLVVLSNSNGLSFGASGNTITASIGYTTSGVGAFADSAQTAATGTVVFANSNNISFGMSGSSQITVSHNAITAAIQSISAGATRVTSGQAVLSNSNSFSFGISNQTVTATASAPTFSFWPYFDPIGLALAGLMSDTLGTTGGSSQSTLSFIVCPLTIPDYLAFNEIDVLIGGNQGTAGTGSITYAHQVGLYTLNQGTRLDSVSTMVFNLYGTQNSVTSQSWLWYWGTNSATNSSGITVPGNSFMGGNKNWRVPLYAGATTLTPGNYWMVYNGSSRSTGTNFANFVNICIVSNNGTTSGAGAIGPATTYVAPYGLQGVISATSNDTGPNKVLLPANILTAAVISTAGGARVTQPWIKFLSTT